MAADTPDPVGVTIAGNLQDEPGCPWDWQPDCVATFLAFDGDNNVWQGAFDIPAGMWEYKAALNSARDESFGLGGMRDGPHTPLDLAADTPVKFYFSQETHWITGNRGAMIATAPGDVQSEIGGVGDWDPACLRSWLQDPDGDGEPSLAWLVTVTRPLANELRPLLRS